MLSSKIQKTRAAFIDKMGAAFCCPQGVAPNNETPSPEKGGSLWAVLFKAAS